MSIAKRFFDIFWSLLGIILLIPFFAFSALIIKIEDRGPVFFRQKRVGYKGRLFNVWKFRTMVINAEELGGKLTIGRDPRITRVGYWLRKIKLDELPQLINVLLGEMSFVGPRPEVPRYVDMYDAKQRNVLNLMPGITDPASIKFRNESELLAKVTDPEETYMQEIIPEKIRLNLEYAEKSTVWSDAFIIVKTLFHIVPLENRAKGQRGYGA